MWTAPEPAPEAPGQGREAASWRRDSPTEAGREGVEEEEEGRGSRAPWAYGPKRPRSLLG